MKKRILALMLALACALCAWLLLRRRKGRDA